MEAQSIAATRSFNTLMGQSQSLKFLNYDGAVGQVYKIWLLNIALTIVTLGVYSFWGKTRIRKYVARSFTLVGDRFEYTGTGGELFKGFLKALPFIIAIYAPLIIFPPEQYPLTSMIFVLFFYLYLVAMYAALRYRLSRTTWRGIRGRLTGSAFAYGALSMGVGSINIMSLGLIAPLADEIVLDYQMNHVWFGNTRGKFTGKAKPLWGIHFITWFLALPTLTLSRIWYRMAVFRFQFNHFKVDGVGFRADPTGWDLFCLVFGNALILLFTLGLGTPFTIQRNMKFLANHVAFEGDIEAESEKITQSLEELSSSGEGLDGALGLDSGLF